MARERAPEGPKALDRILGVRFRDASLRELALTHRSYAFEQELPANNERLEFLGDAVLGIVVTDMAFREFPEMPEGELAKLRAAIVNMSALADAARDLGLGRFDPARSRRGDERWPRQEQHPGRCARGRAGRGLPRPGPSRRRAR